VLRLLPERLYAGLLGDGAWLALGAKNQPIPISSPLPANAKPVETLDALLQAYKPKGRASKISIMLPGQAAHCVSLPWSPHLRSSEEKQAYARAHIEQAGLGVGEGYIVHAEFRHYGARGFAYAVPQDLLKQLHTVAARHSLELTTALPIAGIAHLAARPARGAGLELTLVIDDAVVSALAMDSTGLQHYDAEPAIGGSQAALRRLMTRLAANNAELKAITICGADEDDALVDIASSFSAQEAVRSVRAHQWRRYL
jgi:hypothetical protein